MPSLKRILVMVRSSVCVYCIPLCIHSGASDDSGEYQTFFFAVEGDEQKSYLLPASKSFLQESSQSDQVNVSRMYEIDCCKGGRGSHIDW